MGAYHCRSGPQCKGSFTTERGLSLHRRNCQHYKRHEAAALSKRKETLKLRKEAAQKVQTQSCSDPGQSRPLEVNTNGAGLAPPNPSSYNHHDDTSMDVDRATVTLMNFDAPNNVLSPLRPSSPLHPSSLLHPPSQLSSSPFPSPPLPLLAEAEKRPQRDHHMPARYRDVQPEGPLPLPLMSQNQILMAPGSSALPRVILHVRDTLRTGPNQFGVFREYPHRPSHDPDNSISEDDLSNCRPSQPVNYNIGESTRSCKPPWPFTNMTIYLLMEWMNTGSNKKSLGEVNRLTNDVLRSDQFNLNELEGFDAQRENQRLDSTEGDDSQPSPFSHDGWLESGVHLSIPTGSKDVCGLGQKIIVPGLYRRPLCAVMKAALADVISLRFHFSPFKRFWRTASGADERCYDEAYTSDTWIKAHDDLQKQTNEPGCKLEKVILGLMFWSDSTHLANFGTAKVWPLYMYFGNLSKYVRGKPSSGASHHVAYIPSIPDHVQDSIPNNSQKPVLVTHCRRELMHGVWNQILDDEFITAYRHGFTMECLDGVWRRFYPRIFTYSADYPEKVLLSGVRNNGNCPCPRCLVEKTEISKLGQSRDNQSRLLKARSYVSGLITQARDFIYKKGLNIAGAAVERLLFPKSWVPTFILFENSFAEKLGTIGLNPYIMLVVDLLHEFELGVWKAIFTHLIRILYAAAPAGRLVAELDRRYRLVPTFGRSTIRRFSTNASEMKKLAARNFEDLLQCAIPVFEGLLPSPHNEAVLTLLYRLAQWHALAKLRMHTDSSLDLMDSVTTILGRELRRFQHITCSAFSTMDLPKEQAARGRRKKQCDAKSSARARPDGSIGTSKTDAIKSTAAKRRKFNLWTYKLHSLGDYVRTIRAYGTTDSYSTQTGELEHRRVKRLYGRTNKKSAIKQLTKHERRETRLLRARRAAASHQERTHTHQVSFSENDTLPYTDTAMHHHISDSKKHSQDAFSFLRSFPSDPATKNFVPRLKDHLLGRLLGETYDGDEQNFSDAERNTVRIVDNRIFSAKVLRINYTSYDVRRDQDSMNPRTNADVMVLSPETDPDSHLYWYARVLGVFHARVVHTGSAATNRSVQHVEFLWVRWFGMVPGHRYGPKAARLPKIGFVPDTDPLAFGFLDPSLVIRGCHLIPAFNEGRTADLLTASLTAGRPIGEVDDWVSFYVNIFADRDMFMRHNGGGVGHCHASTFSSRRTTNEGLQVRLTDKDEDDPEPLDADDADNESEDKDEDEDEEDNIEQSDPEDDDLGPEDGENDDDDEEDNYDAL